MRTADCFVRSLVLQVYGLWENPSFMFLYVHDAQRYSWITGGLEEELGGHAPNSPSENGEETHLGIFRLPTPGSLHRRRENTAQEEFGTIMGECM